jgi:flagellar operon protein
MSIAKTTGVKGIGGAGSIGSTPIDSVRNREATGAEFRKSLSDSIAQETAARPAAVGSTQIAQQVSKALSSVGVAESLKFSAHAVDRMKSRGISFAPDMMKGIENAVSRAASKGSKDTLVLAGDNALIVSVKNNTVVTVMDKNAMRDNVFTNIDSTVVV